MNDKMKEALELTNRAMALLTEAAAAGTVAESVVIRMAIGRLAEGYGLLKQIGGGQ